MAEKAVPMNDKTVPSHIKAFLTNQPQQISNNVKNMFRFMEMMTS